MLDKKFIAIQVGLTFGLIINSIIVTYLSKNGANSRTQNLSIIDRHYAAFAKLLQMQITFIYTHTQIYDIVL